MSLSCACAMIHFGGDVKRREQKVSPGLSDVIPDSSKNTLARYAMAMDLSRIFWRGEEFFAFSIESEVDVSHSWWALASATGRFKTTKSRCRVR